jgi:preprotein translocase subunit SecA
MSFFSRIFGKRPSIEERDLIWMGQTGALAGLEKELRERMSRDRLVIVMAHFPDRMTELEDMLQRSSIAYRSITASLIGQNIDQHFDRMDQATVLLARSDTIPDTLPPEADHRDPQRSISILFRERHPLRRADQRVAGFVASLPCAARLCFFDALDDELVTAFAGDWVRLFLEQSGMKEEDRIESPMVARRIKAAQQKVEERYEHARKTGQTFHQWRSTDRTMPG